MLRFNFTFLWTLKLTLFLILHVRFFFKRSHAYKCLVESFYHYSFVIESCGYKSNWLWFEIRNEVMRRISALRYLHIVTHSLFSLANTLKLYLWHSISISLLMGNHKFVKNILVVPLKCLLLFCWICDQRLSIRMVSCISAVFHGFGSIN